MKRLNKTGFTIVELMIATSILSVILVTVTVVMVGIGNLYYKGINQINIQDTTRNISDEISQKLQLSDGMNLDHEVLPTDHNIQAYCIGSTRYTYVLNHQMGDHDDSSPYMHVLWRDSISSGACGTAIPDLKQPNISGSTDGVELLGNHSRLTEFDIAPPNLKTSPYTLTVGVAYGDNDLLCNTGVSGDCDASDDTAQHQKNLGMDGTVSHPLGGIICRGSTGQQFCATSHLQVIVAKRLG